MHGLRRSGLAWRALLGALAPVASLALLCHAAPPRTLLGQSLEEFAARRQNLRQAAHGAVVLIAASDEQSDRERYRADNAVVYLTGVEIPGAVVALLPEGDPLGVPCAVFLRRGWGSSFNPEDVRNQTGVESVLDQRDMWEKLRPSLERAETVYVQGGAVGRERFGTSTTLADRVRSINPSATLRPLLPLLADLRVKKSPGEIANLRAAVGATVRGFERAAPSIRAGVTELTVEGQILAGFREAGAPREGFPAVIGSGPNSIILHNDPTNRPMEKGETVVVDIGAEINYYTADLTRTFPVGGRFTPRARAIYELVRQVQQACERHIQPGKTTWSDLQRFARDQFLQSPLRAADGSGEMRTMDRFFNHGIGHWLGMDVHDVGAMSGPIPVGSVITIEPGLYIASEHIGVRIEDDYLITEAGVERLSAALPSDIPSIERMMRRR